MDFIYLVMPAKDMPQITITAIAIVTLAVDVKPMSVGAVCAIKSLLTVATAIATA